MVVITRRSFCVLGAVAAASRALASSGQDGGQEKVAWHDVVDWPIEGRIFDERKAAFDRLPAAAEGIVREAVWNLSRDSAGMVVRFATTSSSLHVRYRLTNARLDMPHMPATGVSGVDLYGCDRSGSAPAWRWIAVSRPSKQDVQAKLFGDAAAVTAPREFQLYLPLYNGIEKLELGVEEGTKVAALPPRKQPPILCYGTSIMHGACASRPGMAWPAIVGRTLDREMMNFGFSGNGRMEAEVAKFLLQADPAVFVIDCLPNMSPQMVAERTPPLVRQIRAARPQTPILLVEDRTFGNAWFDSKRAEEHVRRRQALREAVAALRGDGMTSLYLLGGADLLGEDGTTDGSHPNDLGMMRQADRVTAGLRAILGN